MDSWYPSYFSQTWYVNTFLVRRANQIAQAVAGDREWNNICDSGCNFTCLAMILGVDPARLASELRNQNYFYADAGLPAKRLDGTRGGLVWDQNAPHKGLRSVSINNFWHSSLMRRVSLTLSFLDVSSTDDYEKGCDLVSAIRARGNHVVCGSQEHSQLVAGETTGGGYFLWDPDGSEMTVEENLAGDFTLQKLFSDNPGTQIEFWEYSCVVG